MPQMHIWHISRKKGGVSLARIDAYAYYLQTYGNTKPSRYDSHKKSDLRKIYNTIVKTNKESPLYKLSNTDDVARYAIDIKENAKNIQNVVASLSDSYGDFQDSFQKKVAVSSDDDIVSVKYVGDGSEENTSSFDIEIKRLSSPQINVGNYLKNDALYFTPGSYSFDLNTNRSSYEFQFNVKNGETNLDIMRKLADLVNHSTLGITATIRNGSSAIGGVGTSALALTSTQTGLGEGESYLFDISPSAKADSIRIMEQLGIDKITSQAKNSSFTLNGVEYSSLANTFTVNNTFELTLKSTTDEASPAQIGFKTSTDSIADNIMSLVDAFNRILKIAEETSTEASGEPNKLYNELNALAKVRQDTLSSIGLIVAENGSISLNREILADAISPDNAENTYTMLSHFKDAIGAKADHIAINPMNYVNKIVVAYKNPGKTFSAPYFTSVYSGMMLDRYV